MRQWRIPSISLCLGNVTDLTNRHDQLVDPDSGQKDVEPSLVATIDIIVSHRLTSPRWFHARQLRQSKESRFLGNAIAIAQLDRRGTDNRITLRAAEPALVHTFSVNTPIWRQKMEIIHTFAMRMLACPTLVCETNDVDGIGLATHSRWIAQGAPSC